jgi:hypothetical protein
MANLDVVSPVWKETLRRRRVGLLVLLLVILVVVVAAAYLSWRLSPNEPANHADDREHLKYGSIGSEEGHVSYRI